LRNPSGVVIATPSALHAEHRSRAPARHGGVLPEASRPHEEEVRAVLDAARAADRLLAVDLSYRCTRAVQAIRDRFGELGEVYAAHLASTTPTVPTSPGSTTRASRRRLRDGPRHPPGRSALWLLDAPRVERVASSLSQKGRKLRGRDAVEDHGAALLELSTGCSVQLGLLVVLAGRPRLPHRGVVLRNARRGIVFQRETALSTIFAPSCSAALPGSLGRPARRLGWPRRGGVGRTAGYRERFDPHAEELAAVAATIDRIYAGG